MDEPRRRNEFRRRHGRQVRVTESAEWRNLLDVRRAFHHADAVTVGSGRTVVVFNIAGNHYRLITAIHNNTQLVYALRFLTHAEYDRDAWKEQL